MTKRFNVDQAIIDLLTSADALATASAGASALAIITLARDVSDKAFEHGEAKALADTLAEKGLKSASAKRAAEVAAQLVNAGHHVKLVAKAAAKTRPAALEEGEQAWEQFWTQASECTSVAGLRALAKKVGPKGDKGSDKEDDKSSDVIQGASVASDPAQEKAVALETYKTALKAALGAGISPDTLKALIRAEGKGKAQVETSIETIGQLREVRECIAMINAGQCQPGEGLVTIATIVGVPLVKAA